MTSGGDPSSLNEFDLIRRYFSHENLPDSVLVGVGDDCATVALPADNVLAVSVDTQLPSVHFPANTAPANIASRALHCAASDLAAMGARPLGFTLALTLPSADENWLAGFSTGLLSAAHQLACPLIGGDTTRGPLCISIQVLGSVPAGQTLQRKTAQVGDRVWVSGALGDGAAALAMLEKRQVFSDQAEQYLLQRFYRPDVDFDLAVFLRQYASSCIDISDGLIADLTHICTASGVGAHIVCDELPVSLLWKNSVDSQQAIQWALCGGDDYRLCFTASPQYDGVLKAYRDLYCIGRIIDGSGVAVLDKQGASLVVNHHGYQHF